MFGYLVAMVPVLLLEQPTRKVEVIVITVSAFRLVQRFLCFFVVGALALSYVLPSMAVDFNRVSVATSLALRGEEIWEQHTIICSFLLTILHFPMAVHCAINCMWLSLCSVNTT